MMFSRSIVAAALAFSAAVVLAQDEVVPADKEPRHVPKLVNEWVRIVDVEIPEGEQTLYHRHSLDYPYVLVTSVTLFNQIYGQDPKDVKMEAGAYATPITYQGKDGKQYVAIVATGGSFLDSPIEGDALHVFALP